MDKALLAKSLGAVAAVAGLATVVITNVDGPWSKKKDLAPTMTIPTQEWIDMRSENLLYEFQIDMYRQDLEECETELIGE